MIRSAREMHASRYKTLVPVVRDCSERAKTSYLTSPRVGCVGTTTGRMRRTTTRRAYKSRHLGPHKMALKRNLKNKQKTKQRARENNMRTGPAAKCIIEWKRGEQRQGVVLSKRRWGWEECYNFKPDRHALFNSWVQRSPTLFVLHRDQCSFHSTLYNFMYIVSILTLSYRL